MPRKSAYPVVRKLSRQAGIRVFLPLEDQLAPYLLLPRRVLDGVGAEILVLVHFVGQGGDAAQGAAAIRGDVIAHLEHYGVVVLRGGVGPEGKVGQAVANELAVVDLQGLHRWEPWP